MEHLQVAVIKTQA